MSDEPRKRGWVYWVAIAVGLLLVYVLSIGPVFWVLSRTEVNNDTYDNVIAFYFPVWQIAHWLSPSLVAALHWYIALYSHSGP